MNSKRDKNLNVSHKYSYKVWTATEKLVLITKCAESIDNAQTKVVELLLNDRVTVLGSKQLRYR